MKPQALRQLAGHLPCSVVYGSGLAHIAEYPRGTIRHAGTLLAEERDDGCGQGHAVRVPVLGLVAGNRPHAQWLELQDGRRVVAELRICAAPPPPVAGTTRAGRHKGERPTNAPVPAGGITARLLRTVKLGASAEPVIADYRRWIKRNFGADALQRLDAHTGRPARRRRKKRPRTRRAVDGFYAELARDYVELSKRGVRAPTATLAKLRGERIEKIRSHIHLARKNGLLTETKPGKAGGVLTPLALAVLEEAKL